MSSFAMGSQRFWPLKSCVGNWVNIRLPKQSAIRLNADPVSREP